MTAADLPPPPDWHPLANLFPLIEGEDFDALVADIRDNGLQDGIVLSDGRILDGRNRYRALRELAETGEALGGGWKPLDGQALPPHFLDPAQSPHFLEFDRRAHGDPLAFVLSKNLRRRHLTESQRAMVAAGIANLDWGGDRRSDQAANLPDENAGGRASLDHDAVSQERAAEMLNVSERTVRSAKGVLKTGVAELGDAVRQGRASVSAAAEIARLPQADQQRIIAEIARQPETKRAFRLAAKDLRREGQDDKRARRETREAELGARQQALPAKRYGVILADPEWRFEPYSRETGMDRAADNHYPTSVTEVIAARARLVAEIAADDCLLLLWATAPMLPDALAVMAAWGFTYKTHAIWLKDKIGTGYWFRSQHELLLLGVRGDLPAPAMGDQFRSALAFDAGAHSEKPPFAHEIAEAYFPNLPKIELNARARRPGWDAWGNEAPEEDIPEGRSGTAREAPSTSEGRDDAEACGWGSAVSRRDTVRRPPGLNEAVAGAVPVPPDLEIPDSLRREALTAADEATLAAFIADPPASLTFNDRMLLKKLREHPEAATVLDRRRLATLRAKAGETA